MAQLSTDVKRIQKNVASLTQVHALYAAAFAALIIISRAWNLVTVEAAWQRTIVAVIMASVVLAVWHYGKDKSKNPTYYRGLGWLLVVLDIFVATFIVFSQRGVASRGVALYAFAVATAAVIVSRFGLMVTTLMSIASYAVACLVYGALHPGENYKIELYGELAFYAAMLFVLSSLVRLVASTKR